MKISEAIRALQLFDENTEVELVFPEVIDFDMQEPLPSLDEGATLKYKWLEFV